MDLTAGIDLSAVTWHKSSKSSGGGSNCVEIAQLSGTFAIRDSKNRDGGTLFVRGAVFRDLIDSVKQGSLDS
jgi:Domain of unknown function (DUF397)